MTLKTVFPAAIFLFPPTFAFSETNPLSAITWKGAGTGDIAALLAAATLIGIAFRIYYLRQKRNTDTVRAAYGIQAFNEAAQDAGLSADERGLALELSRRVKNAEPHTVITNSRVFEECVGADITAKKSQGLSSPALRQYSERVATLRRRIGFQLHPADLPLFNTRNIEPGQTGVLADAETGRVLCEKAIVGAHDELHLMLRLADESPVIRPGTLVRFAFTRHHDGAYAPRLKAAGSEGASLLLLEHTPDLGRRQMRQYIRAEADLPMKIRLVSRIRTDAGQAPEGVFDGRTIDISGGGISFRTDPLLLPGDVVGCWISLPDGPLGEAPTRVLRVSQDSGPDSPVMRYHAEFQDMPFRQRDRLVRLAGKLLSRPARKTQ